MVIAREEIFGPVMSIITYNDLDEAIEIANDTEYGLAGYVFGTDKDLGLQVCQGHRIIIQHLLQCLYRYKIELGQIVFY